MAERPDDGRPRRRRQQQADRTRRQLLAAAGEVFERHGYQATTVRAITTRARTAHGTFYLYFENKEDVFCRLLEIVIVGDLEDGSHTFLEAGPDRDRLAAAVGRFAASFASRAGLWRALLEGMLQSRAIRDLWLELRGRTVRRLADEVRAQQGRGLVRAVEPVALAHALTAMTEWFAFTQLALDHPLGEPGVASASGGAGDPGPGGAGGPGGRLDVVVDTLADVWFHAVYGRAEPG